MKALKIIATAGLIVIALASFVLLASEADSLIGQLALSGCALLSFYGSYKGLEHLGAFDNIK